MRLNKFNAKVTLKLMRD